jgi:protein-S-isoprenylcysteine O-methyltransferase Ste14
MYYTEKRLGEYRDSYYEFGLFATGAWKNIDWENFKTGIWSWFIRGFFLPMNFCTAVSMFENLRNSTNLELFLINSPITISYPIIENIIFLMLIIAIIPGYYFSSRLLGTNGVSISQTWPAWIVTLWFYPPFNIMINNSWIDYTHEIVKGQQNWISIFGNSPITIYFIATILITMGLIHFWGEAILGMRASVNTNKGIITNGPFKYTKHPIYVSKVVAWFLATLPFISTTSFLQNTKFFIAFCCVAAGYTFRSYFEEKFLATDSTYVAYARYIDQKGVLRFINKIFPFMSFEWRYNYWKKKGDI